MSEFAIRPEDLQGTLSATLGERVQRITLALGEVTVHVAADQYHGCLLYTSDAADD